MFKEGEWIIYNLGDNKDFFAFIHHVGTDDTQFVTTPIRFMTGRSVLRIPTWSVREWGSSLTEEDYDALIDMALHIKDKTWFMELCQKKQNKEKI